jgi:hypothetical protein
LLKTIAADTLQATGAEDKSLLGSKAERRLRGQDQAGASAELSPSGKLISLGLASTR